MGAAPFRSTHQVKELSLAQQPIDVVVGARLSAIRTARGVSPDQLGTVLGITGNDVLNYESGTVRIPAAHLLEICRYFQINLADLFPTLDPNQDPNVH